MFKHRLRSVTVLILIVILALPFFTTPVSAAYENTHKNTGNMRNDIIAVALTQVGYREGSNNYTKYGVWYGKPNSPWCGMFVSWCAKEAGIPTSVLKRTGVANPKSFGLTAKDGKNYTPKKGDLFFKKSGSHVGLVYYTEGNYFYTIEGNTYTSGVTVDCVMIRKRKISDFNFASPDYSGSGSSSSTSSTSSTSSSSSSSGCSHKYQKKVESAHPHKEYKVCSKCNKKSYTGVKKVIDSCNTCVQANCKHSYSTWKKVSETKHSRTCSKCGVKETDTHHWEKGKIIKAATCVDAGKQQMICSDCKAETTKKIKATGQHKYGAFTFVDNETHKKICKECGHEISAKHKPDSKWKHDGIYHWTSCTACDGRMKDAEHQFPDGCLSPCSTCGYTMEDGHKLTGVNEYNNEVHWEVCDRCGLHANEESHQYTAECDQICNTCGFERISTISHHDEYHADETGHWRRCGACMRVTDIVSHVEDRTAEEWEDHNCVECGFLLRSDDSHVHTYDSVEANAKTHWGTCACGEEMAPEVHSWDFQTGECSICGIANTPDEASGNFLVTLINRIFG